MAHSPDKSFRVVALGWHKSNKKWSQNTADRLLASMNRHIFPVIGHQPVTSLKAQHFTALLKGIEGNGLLEMASRTRQHLCNIMRFAVQQGLVENNPAEHLDGVTVAPVRHHHPALPLERLPELLNRIENYQQGHHGRHADVASVYSFK